MSDSHAKPWLRAVPDGVRISLKVMPKASADRIEGVEAGAVRVRVTAAPDKGKANARVVKLLAKALGVPAGSVSIVADERSRSKIAEVHGVTAEEARNRLANERPARDRPN